MNNKDEIIKKQSERSNLIAFGKELEAWLELPFTKKVLELIKDGADQRLLIIDDPKLDLEGIKEARLQRMAMQWFLNTLKKAEFSWKEAESKFIQQQNLLDKAGDKK